MESTLQTVRIYPLRELSPSLMEHLRESQREAARVWNLCRALRQEAREGREPWPTRDSMQRATKGHFALHSQPVQAASPAIGMWSGPRICTRWRSASRFPSPLGSRIDGLGRRAWDVVVVRTRTLGVRFRAAPSLSSAWATGQPPAVRGAVLDGRPHRRRSPRNPFPVGHRECHRYQNGLLLRR